MNICLKTHAKQSGSRTVVVRVEDRKPTRVSSQAELTCVFKVEDCTDYYLLTLDVSGSLEITCQRCVTDFQQEYMNQTKLAVCANDEIAERLMASYECVVVNNYEIDLMDIVTDELHLFLPEKHPDIAGCDLDISGLIGDII